MSSNIPSVGSDVETDIITMLQSQEDTFNNKILNLWNNDNFKNHFNSIHQNINQWFERELILTAPYNPLPQLTDEQSLVWSYGINFAQPGTIILDGEYYVVWCGVVVSIIEPVTNN